MHVGWRSVEIDSNVPLVSERELMGRSLDAFGQPLNATNEIWYIILYMIRARFRYNKPDHNVESGV